MAPSSCAQLVSVCNQLFDRGNLRDSAPCWCGINLRRDSQQQSSLWQRPVPDPHPLRMPWMVEVCSRRHPLVLAEVEPLLAASIHQSLWPVALRFSMSMTRWPCQNVEISIVFGSIREWQTTLVKLEFGQGRVLLPRRKLVTIQCRRLKDDNLLCCG